MPEEKKAELNPVVKKNGKPDKYEDLREALAELVETGMECFVDARGEARVRLPGKGDSGFLIKSQRVRAYTWGLFYTAAQRPPTPSETTAMVNGLEALAFMLGEEEEIKGDDRVRLRDDDPIFLGVRVVTQAISVGHSKEMRATDFSNEMRYEAAKYSPEHQGFPPRPSDPAKCLTNLKDVLEKDLGVKFTSVHRNQGSVWKFERVHDAGDASDTSDAVPQVEAKLPDRKTKKNKLEQAMKATAEWGDLFQILKEEGTMKNPGPEAKPPEQKTEAGQPSPATQEKSPKKPGNG